VSKIIVDNVSKEFRLQADPPGSIKEMFTRRDRSRERTHFWALKDVSLEIPEGSMFALVGHNGSGKSTLLRCIAGIYQPTSGRVSVHGRMSTLLELGAGFHPDLSGRENIYLNATILGMKRKEIDKRFDEIVDFAGVEQFIDSPVKVYSTGMYVRLGFSVAVHVQPEILIIDEVIAVGDEQFQRKCFDHLYGLRKQGVTIVVVTHGMGTVETMCDNAAWLDHGRLQIEGPAPEVTAAYIAKVNATEAEERHEADAAVDGDSTSSAEPIQLTSVEFLDEGGQEVASATHDQPLVIRLNYRATQPIEHPQFGIALHTANGIILTGTNTQIDKVDTGVLMGEGRVEFVVPRVPLVPGEYLLSVAITDTQIQHFFVRRDKEWRILVRHGDALPPAGLMDLWGTWSLESEAADVVRDPVR
jgi:ABC-2 type transport system ATP-binding protein/lipopolysaccharide transport system ATP-binding protein